MALFNSKSKTNDPSKYSTFSFNLLRPARPKLPIWDKIYLWLSGTCRVIIIFVEISVILSLGYRFFIDRNANDLKNQITNELNVLDYDYPLETKLRKYQSTISLFNSLGEIAPVSVKTMPEIYTLTKGLGKFDFILSEKDFRISGTASKEQIDLVEKSLKSSATFKSVVVSSLVSSSSNAGNTDFDFSISGEFK